MFTPRTATLLPPRFVPDCENQGLYAGIEAGIGMGMGIAGTGTAFTGSLEANMGWQGAAIGGGLLAIGAIVGGSTGAAQAAATKKTCCETDPRADPQALTREVLRSEPLQILRH